MDSESAVAVERFAELLRQFRARTRLSQAELAEKANLSTRAISDLERGVRSRPYLPTVRALAEALGLDEEESQRFAASVRRARLGRETFAGSGGQSDIPLPISSFVDREGELALLTQLVLGGKRRLITLIGPPGVGKTRLALETARQLSYRHAMRIIYVNLMEQSQAEQLLMSVAAAFGVTPGRPEELPALIASSLRDAPCLLILDNLEHLLAPTRHLVALLGSSPLITILATSRAPTLVRGEQQIVLTPLRVPSEDEMSEDAEALAAFPGVSLLIARLLEHTPALKLDTTNTRKIAEVARMIEGIPLAIEIAAGYGQLLSLDDLGEIVSRPLDLTAHNSLDGAQTRHGTLRNAVDWSYRLLAPADQWALRRLSVLSRPFAIDDAFDVLTDEFHPRFRDSLRDGALEMILHLAQQGLLSRVESASASVFIMLNLVREYARNQLEHCGEAPAAYAALLTTALKLSEVAACEVGGTEEDTWRDLIKRRTATIVSAIGRCWAEGDLETGTTILWNISFAFYGGPPGWARLWVEEALEEPCQPACREGKLLILAALFGMMTGARAPAAELARRGFSLLTAESYPTERNQAFDLLRFFVRAPELAELVPEADARVESLRAEGDSVKLSRALRGRGMRRLAIGEVEGAEADFTEGLNLLPRRASTTKRALLHGLAAVKIRKGDVAAAKQLLLSGLNGRFVGTPVMAVSQMFNLLGLVSEMLGEAHNAAKAYESALKTALAMGTATPLRPAFQGAASLATSYGRAEEAARLLGAAAKPELTDAVRDLVPASRRDDLEPALRVRLGNARFEAALRQGKELSLERATAEALEDLEHTIREPVDIPAPGPEQAAPRKNALVKSSLGHRTS